MNIAYLLTGGNLGNRMANLKQAEFLISPCCGAIIQTSSIYETDPWGITDQPLFLNRVIKIHTSLYPEELMQQLLLIEEEMGRKRTTKLGPRIIDIDILLMNEVIMHTPTLIIPHPRLTERRFALTPLAEIAGNEIHPVNKKNIKRLLIDCKDTLHVYKISAAN